MPLSSKIFAWTHKCHWHLAQNSIPRYKSQDEVLCHFPTWSSFCKHHVKGHRNTLTFEAQACTQSLSPPGLDTNAGTECIALLYLLSSFSDLITIKISSLSTHKLEFIVSVSARVLHWSTYFCIKHPLDLHLVTFTWSCSWFYLPT